MSLTLRLPRANGALHSYQVREAKQWPRPSGPARTRIAFAAAHVVPDPLAAIDPRSETALDWDATLRFRRHLWSLGFRVAEAMDTAQRGMGLDWSASKELIQRSSAEAHAARAGIACGAGTDHLQPPYGSFTIADVERSYAEQCEFVQRCGSQVILMASRALAACAKGQDDYHRVYGRILRGLERPAILHWLGDAFDPALAGYWGSQDLDQAMDTALGVIEENHVHVDGIKVSLLDRQREIDMRRRLPKGVRMYTGDDFHYDELIKGDEQGYSDALLGIFDPIAPVAAAAFQALDEGRMDEYDQILAPTLPLSRHIFRRPTFHYKTGVVFLAYLNGHQSHYKMVGGMESARSILHLGELFVLADQAGLLSDPELAVQRMRLVLALAGIE